MNKRYLALEFFKMRRRGIGLTAFGLLTVELLWLTFALTHGVALDWGDPAQPIWEYLLLTQLTLHSLFFPVIAAVTVSRINDIEHKGGTWRLLQSAGQDRRALWRAKFAAAALLLFAVQAASLLYLLALGKAHGIAEPLPAAAFLQCFAGALAVDAAILLLEQWLSIAAENQLIAVAAGLLGAFAGLFSSFMPAAFRYLLIWGYYASLAPAVMRAEPPADGSLPIDAVPVPAAPFLLAAGLAVLLYQLGQRCFVRSEC